MAMSLAGTATTAGLGRSKLFFSGYSGQITMREESRCGRTKVAYLSRALVGDSESGMTMASRPAEERTSRLSITRTSDDAGRAMTGANLSGERTESMCE